jgi:hypothetical protein
VATKQDFAEQVLAGLGAPVSASNVSKLVSWFQHESGGGGGAYNPLDYVIKAPGSSAFNSVGVQNYPDLTTGVSMTVKLLSQQNTQAIRNNLVTDAPFGDFLQAVVNFNAPWTSNAWQQGVLSETEGGATKYWSTGINGDTAATDQTSPPGVAAALLSARTSSSGLLPSPSDLAGDVGGGLLSGGVNVAGSILSGNGILGGALGSVGDWISQQALKLGLYLVLIAGGAGLIVLGAGRTVAPITRPVTQQAQTAAPIVAAAL